MVILLEQNDASAEVHNILGVAYLLARRLDAAAAELKVALDIDSGNIESLVKPRHAISFAARWPRTRGMPVRITTSRWSPMRVETW
jgi:hypothetical protein